MADHPCPFPKAVLDIFEDRLPARGSVLDPYGGIGRIHELSRVGRATVSHELELEWVARAAEAYDQLAPWAAIFRGDSRELPFTDGMFDAVATSPDFGNRMADGYAGERCAVCGGTGLKPEAENGMVQVDPTHIVPAAYATPDELKCADCDGQGRKLRSRRYTYRLSLGRPLTDGNGAACQWGARYQAIHRGVITEFMRCLKVGGQVLVDIKNHRRGGEEQPVMAWWRARIEEAGGEFQVAHPVDTTGLPMSGPDTNDLREYVLEFRKAQ